MSSTTATNGAELPDAKRVKKNDVLDILSPRIFQDEEQLRTDHASATPYPHGHIMDMFVDGFLERVLHEVKQNTKVNFKESDLFRVYQSVDLGNMSPTCVHAKNMPSLMALKEAIYSPPYRAFMERLVGLPPNTLTEQVDCAANCHAPGCHLLCHDDVIGSRKVSFIIYLTDKEWTRQEGGCLELYPSSSSVNNHHRREPEVNPSKTIVPTFNSMAYFQVQPGVSFHAVQEVLGERPRLSLQGWYHAKEAPAQMQDATLSRLKATGTGEDTEGQFENVDWADDADDSDVCLSNQNVAFLSEYMNATYLSPKSIADIRGRFEEESSVQLRQFMNQEWIDKIDAAREKEDSPPLAVDYASGVNETWKAVGPAHKQRFLEYKDPANDGSSSSSSASMGAMLQHIQTHVFQSEPFGRFLALITGLGLPLGHRGRVRRFRPGLDYTVAHYGILTTQAVLDATLCFAAGTGDQTRVDEETGEIVNGSQEDAIWDSGEVGGFECYIAADEEENEAAAQYNDDDDTELLSVSVSNNTLSLVYRDPGTMRFVKYVGCRAPSSRFDVSMMYQVANDHDDEEGGEEEDEAEGGNSDS